MNIFIYIGMGIAKRGGTMNQSCPLYTFQDLIHFYIISHKVLSNTQTGKRMGLRNRSEFEFDQNNFNLVERLSPH